MFFYDINIPSDHGYICENKIFYEDYTSRLHWHGFVEMEFVISGSGIDQHDGSDYPLKRGDAWILSVHDSHKVICHKGLQLMKVSFKPEILQEDLQKHLSFNHPLWTSFSEEELQSIIEKLDILHTEQENPQPFSRIMTTSIIHELVILIARKTSMHAEPPKGIIQDIAAWLNANYKKDISLTQIADLFSLTPNYIGYLFKTSLGISYKNYLNNLRLKNACHLLSVSDAPVREIAAESGFNSVEYFNILFKKYYSVTPSQYRSIANNVHVKT